MDFNTSLHQELHTTNLHSLFDEFEYDDDVFYGELRRQVLQLTADDDGDDEELHDNKNREFITAQKQCLSNGTCGFSQDRGYYNWSGNKEDVAAPAWILNLWRTGNGTGVFIPQIAPSRRKNRPRRKRNERRRTYKPVEKI